MFNSLQGSQRRLLRWSDLERRYRLPIVALVLSLVGGLGWSAFYHHNLFVQAESARMAALNQAQSRQKTIDDLLARQKALSGQELRQAQELADARATIRRLQQKDALTNTSL